MSEANGHEVARELRAPLRLRRAFDGRGRRGLWTPSRRLGLGLRRWKAHVDLESSSGPRSHGEAGPVSPRNGIDDGAAEPEAVVATTFCPRLTAGRA
jgi:hypothetical protein